MFSNDKNNAASESEYFSRHSELSYVNWILVPVRISKDLQLSFATSCIVGDPEVIWTGTPGERPCTQPAGMPALPMKVALGQRGRVTVPRTLEMSGH